MSPHLRGRVDIDKFNKGLKQMENFLPSIQGPTRYREGFKWLDATDSGNVRLIDFSINNETRFLISLSAGLLRVYSREGTLLFTRTDGQYDEFGNLVDIPYLDSEIYDVRWSTEVDTLIFTHPKYPPYQITANTDWDELCLLTSADEELHDADSRQLYAQPNGAAGNTTWEWTQVAFTAHPFEQIDTSNTVLRLGDELEALRVESDTAGTFTSAVTASALSGGLNSNPVYTEYKVGDQWSLGRILDSTTTPAAPVNPTGTVVYVDAVSKVVNIEDPSVRLAMIHGEESGDASWTVRDGVPDGEYHVRADAVIFRTSHIGAWVRIGGEQLLTSVCNPTTHFVGYPAGYGFTDEYSSQDGHVRWGRIKDYRGVEDHPVDFIYDTYASHRFDSGEVYEVYRWGGGVVQLDAYDGTGIDDNYDRAAVVYKDTSTWRFGMSADLIYRTIKDGTKLRCATDQCEPTILAITANMSTQRQFDVVEVEDVLVEGSSSYPKLISPSATATLSTYDVVTDPDAVAFHTGVVSSSKPFFDANRDKGRYLLGAILDDWVLMRIRESGTTDKQASVDVLSSVPISELSGNITNNGVFTRFRMGAWYEGNWPLCCSYYEQRRVFAGSDKHPNMVWLSNLNDPADFRTVEENGQVLDTSGITYQLGTSSTIIRWLAAGPTLICGTEANEWQLRPNEFSAAITPSNIRITQETSVGSLVQGIRTGAAVFFPHISGKQFHEFKFDFQTQQFVVSTVTKLVPDLFETDKIKSITFQYHPNSSFWIVTEGGKLYSLTYRQEDDFYAWAVHSSGAGVFKDAAVLPKGDAVHFEDQLWVVVERDGTNQLEMLSLQFTDDLSDDYKLNAAYLDSHVRNPATGTLSSPTTQVYIPARVVKDGKACIVVDGVNLGSVSVTADTLNTLPDGVEASKYTCVGLPYTGKLQLNPQAFPADGKNAYGQINRMVSMRPYVYKSMGYKVGYDEENLETIDPMGGTSLYTGFMDEHNILGSQFNVDDTPTIVQDQPYPLTLISAVIKTEM